MIRRLMLGGLILVMGFVWGGTVGAQDTEKSPYNDPDLAYQEARQLLESMSTNTILEDIRSDRCEQPMGAEPLILWMGLKTLPPEIGQVKNVYALYIDSNKLTSLPAEIGQLQSLSLILANSNQLTTLPAEIGQLNCLQWLNLFQNQLTILPPEIGQLKHLVDLNLSENRLTSLPPEIRELTALEYLDLSYNQFTSLPLALGQLPHLRVLSLDGNPLTFPPPDIVAQGTPAILAYLRDYEAMLMRQTIAGIAAGVGGIAGVMLAFRWRQQRGLQEKKKRA
jgi:hypothetical protein